MKWILELVKEFNYYVVILGIIKGNDISVKMYK